MRTLEASSRCIYSISPSHSHRLLRRFINTHGDTYHTKCPVCDGSAIRSIWKIPFGFYKESWIFSFGSETVIEYYFCDTCESVFKNPWDSREHQECIDDQVWAHMRVEGFKKGIEQGYRDRYQHIAPFIPKDSKTIVEVACGGAEYLRLIREDPAFHAERFVGFELSPIIAEYLCSIGLDGRHADIKTPGFAPDLEGKVDCIIMSEAFEHIIFPLRVLEYLMKLLKPGGILWFSAQRVGLGLKIKFHEDYAVTKEGLTLMAEKLGCRIVAMDPECEENPVWYVVFQKP